MANTANTNATNAQTTADGKSDKGHKHIVSEITDLTATATELNYMDGVTSNVQTQLNELDSRFIALENRVIALEREMSASVARLASI